MQSTGKELAFESQVRRFSVPKFEFVDTAREMTRTDKTIVETWSFRFAANLPGETQVPALTVVSRPAVGSGQSMTTND